MASQETGAAFEFYHNQMKLRLLNEEDDLRRVHQRADWLVYRLVTRVHSYFWLDEYPEKDVFLRFLKPEGTSGLTPWQKASLIPDSSVVLEDEYYARLVSDDAGGGENPPAVMVGNPGSEFGFCDCNSAKMGNTCEHVLKMCRVKGVSSPSITLRQYNQVLHDILFRAPLDSLVQDHGVSLAVSVQIMMNSLSESATIPTHGGIPSPHDDGLVCSAEEELLLHEDTGKRALSVGHGSRDQPQLTDDVSRTACLVKCNGNGCLDDDEGVFLQPQASSSTELLNRCSEDSVQCL